MISPLGEPLGAYRLEENSKKIEHAKKLKTDIQNALNFAHKQGVFHLDVRLDNIIYDADAGVFVLIDWSSAACKGGK